MARMKRQLPPSRPPARAARKPQVPAPVMSIGFYGQLIQEADLPQIIAKVGRDLAPGVRVKNIAADLDRAAAFFLSGCLASGADTGTAAARWCRRIEARATAVLDLFDTALDYSPDLRRAAVVLLRQPDARLRAPLDGDAEALLVHALEQTRFLAERARLAAEGYESQPHARGRRHLLHAEVLFLQSLCDIYKEAFGLRPGLGGTPTDTSDEAAGGKREPGGPFPRFVVGVVTLLKDRVPYHEQRAARHLDASLETLVQPAKLRERLRDVMPTVADRKNRARN